MGVAGAQASGAVMASVAKVAHHADRVRAFLAGDRVFPVTVELDITTECNRSCTHCASAGRPVARRLGIGVVKRILGSLAGETRGLLLSGGEPTASPDFPAVLRAARECGFEDVVVVSNGSTLADDAVAESLLRDASAVRVSLYDWDTPVQGANAAILRNIETLRAKVDQQRSTLEIGVSALTSRERASRLQVVADAARSAGAHWIYFHPFCTGWESGQLVQVDQDGVLANIERCLHQERDGFGIFHFPDRYATGPVGFDGYHACHFLLVVGADGKNYLSTELKYLPAYEIADLCDGRNGDFLWDRSRLSRIGAVNTGAYPATAARHRGVLYSAFLTALVRGEAEAIGLARSAAQATHRFPHVL